MKGFFTRWNVFRITRLVVGLAAMVQGVMQKEGLVLVAGGWIMIGAIFNKGCCGSGGCAVQTKKPNLENEVAYEEVVASK